MQAPHFRRSRFFIQPLTIQGFVLFIVFIAWCMYALMIALDAGTASPASRAGRLLLDVLLGALLYLILALAMNWWALRKR